MDRCRREQVAEYNAERPGNHNRKGRVFLPRMFAIAAFSEEWEAGKRRKNSVADQVAAFLWGQEFVRHRVFEEITASFD